MKVIFFKYVASQRSKNRYQQISLSIFMREQKSAVDFYATQTRSHLRAIEFSLRCGVLEIFGATYPPLPNIRAG